MVSLQVDEWVFFKVYLFSFCTLYAGLVLLKHGRERLMEKEKIRLILETRITQGSSSNDDDKQKSRWERFKEWSDRNKAYIGLGILATVGLLLATGIYYNYAETPTPSVAPDSLLRSYIEKASSLRETRNALRAKDFFFQEFTNPREVGGMVFFEKEKMFLSRMFEMFDFYRQNPPTEYQVVSALETMRQFLRSDLKRWTLGEQLHLTMQPHTSYSVMQYHACLIRDWDDVPFEFKALFYFLSQSTTEGPHRQALEAFNFISKDFITKVNNVLDDV